ncbi:unnamed protein product, partial [Effrenium voratum]
MKRPAKRLRTFSVHESAAQQMVDTMGGTILMGCAPRGMDGFMEIGYNSRFDPDPEAAPVRPDEVMVSLLKQLKLSLLKASLLQSLLKVNLQKLSLQRTRRPAEVQKAKKETEEAE